MPRKRYSDPTHTQTLQKAYGRRLRSGFGQITTVIREWVEEDDGLELTAVAHPEDDRYQFLTDPQKVGQFEQWLQDAQEQEVLELINRDGNRYVRKAYQKGLENAERDLARQGITDTDDATDAIALIDQPVHARTLQQLYTRNYDTLEGITEDVADEVREVMTEGFAEGLNPREMGRNIRDRVDTVGKHRATVLARTEVVNAHNEAALTRYEQVAGPNARVQVNAEILTAGDRRVCPICEPRDGEVMTIQEARGSAGPIYHPQCRCTVRANFGRT